MLTSIIRTTLLAFIVVVGALTAWGPAAHAATATQAPSTPGMPVASGVTTTLGSLAWAPSTDSAGVTGYTVLLLESDGWDDYISTNVNQATVTKLAPNTTYTFAVIAHDAAGNSSALSEPVTFTTLPYGTGLACSVFIVPFGDGFTVNAAILNTAPTTSNGWTLTFNLAASAIVNSVFTGAMTRSGDLATIVNAFYSGNIAPGYTVDTGFEATFTGPLTPPSGFALNGLACAVRTNS